MKVNVLKDAKGNVVATFEKSSDKPTPRPNVTNGYKIEEVDVQNIDELKRFYKKDNSKY
jgi:hypothetical protein